MYYEYPTIIFLHFTSLMSFSVDIEGQLGARWIKNLIMM